MRQAQKWKHMTIFFERSERAVVSQANIGTVSKAILGKLLRDEVECICMGFSGHVDPIPS